MAPAGGDEGPVVGSAAQPMELLGSSQDPRQQLKEYKVRECLLPVSSL
jgi:hypothetical protein